MVDCYSISKATATRPSPFEVLTPKRGPESQKSQKDFGVTYKKEDVLILTLNINKGLKERKRELVIEEMFECSRTGFWRVQCGLPLGASTHVWMGDGVLSLNGISLRTNEEKRVIAASLYNRDTHNNNPGF